MKSNETLLAEIDAVRPAAATLAAWWLGQQGFVLKCADSVIYVDAFLSPLPKRTVPPLLEPAKLVNADFDLGSHDHSDHIDRAAWPVIAAASGRCHFVVPDLMRQRVAAELRLPLGRVVGLNDGETVTLGLWRVTGVAAAHEFMDLDPVTGRCPYLGLVIEADGCTVYHASDTCIYDGLTTELRQWRFDMACLPINDRDARRLAAGCIGNMTYQEAADLAGTLQPRLTVPTHFEMFRDNSEDPELFMAYMGVKYPHLRVQRPRHGKRLEVTGRVVDCTGANSTTTRDKSKSHTTISNGVTWPEHQGVLQLKIGDVDRHRRLLDGVGVQCDAYLYDHVNAAAGVTSEDHALVERRLRAIRPSLARMFCHVDWFNPALDGKNCRWDLPGYTNMLRMLRLLQDIGTRVNLVLFSPFAGQTMQTHRASVHAMGELLAHLRDVDGIMAVRWLTIFNEPETVFPHDSPLMRRLFGDARVDGPTNWASLVELWRLAQERLVALELFPHIKLAVPDCVYGSPVRYERMQLAAQEFAERDVDFAVHVYSPENTVGQPQTQDQQRNWAYPGMAREAADFRALAGPKRRMILWEYNLEGLGGRTPFFPGVNQQGVAILETAEAGADILHKTILALQHGYDGACLWCLTDLLYCHSPAAQMQCGMFRFKSALWYPRPHFYYFAPLCQLFRAGMTVTPIENCHSSLLGLAARGADETVAVLLNHSHESRAIRLAVGTAQQVLRLRVHPGLIPASGGDLPLNDWQAIPITAEGAVEIDLVPNEATFLRLALAPITK